MARAARASWPSDREGVQVDHLTLLPRLIADVPALSVKRTLADSGPLVAYVGCFEPAVLSGC